MTDRIQANAKYTDQWLRVRKTRLKKTGATAFFEKFDRAFREYSREAIVEGLGKDDPNWKVTESRTLRGFQEHLDDFRKLTASREADWTDKESRFLKSFETALKAEVGYWKSGPITSLMANRKQPEEAPRQLSLAVDDCGALLSSLRLGERVVQDALHDLEPKLDETHPPRLYEVGLAVLKEANDTLMRDIEIADKHRGRLAKLAVPANDREGKELAGELLQQLGVATKVLAHGQDKHVEWSQAVARYVDGWNNYQQHVREPKERVLDQLQQSRLALDTLLESRRRMAFVRGDVYDHQALRAFDILAKALPAMGKRVETTLRDFTAWAKAVGLGASEGWGASPLGRTSALEALQKDLPSLAGKAKGVDRDLQDLRTFVDEWKDKVAMAKG